MKRAAEDDASGVTIIKGACPHDCPDTCALEVHVKDGVALKVAGSDVEKEGVYIHLARFKLNADRFTEAHQHLDDVTNSIYLELKNRLLHNLAEREKKETTNAPSAKLEIR